MLPEDFTALGRARFTAGDWADLAGSTDNHRTPSGANLETSFRGNVEWAVRFYCGAHLADDKHLRYDTKRAIWLLDLKHLRSMLRPPMIAIRYCRHFSPSDCGTYQEYVARRYNHVDEATTKAAEFNQLDAPLLVHSSFFL